MTSLLQARPHPAPKCTLSTLCTFILLWYYSPVQALTTSTMLISGFYEGKFFDAGVGSSTSCSNPNLEDQEYVCLVNDSNLA
jgi:hypothetical protein